MDQRLLLVLAVLAVGIFHTLVPDHWLPITLVARQQGWTKREVAGAAAVAGTGHTLSTLLLGLVVWIAGVAFATKFGNLVSTVSSVALIAFGGWFAISSLRALRNGGGHGHSHDHGHSHEANAGFHGPDVTRIATDHGVLELSIYETSQPPRFRLSGHSGDRFWLETRRDGGARQRFEFVNRGDFWESLDDIPEPHKFIVTGHVAHGGHVHSYETAFAEHDHTRDPHSHKTDALYMPSPAGTAVLTQHVHAHRHGSTVHVHLHDHAEDTWHPDIEVDASDPPLHKHRHKRSFRITLLMILGSSPMVEGIPAFFAASKYGVGLIAVMAAVFAISTIATYVLLSVTSVAGLQRVSFGPLERYGEVISGCFILAVGIASLFWL